LCVIKNLKRGEFGRNFVQNFVGIGFKKIANYIGYKVEKRKCKNK